MQRQTLQGSYKGGSIQDLPRHELPAGSVWKLFDFIPDLDGAPLQKRGGWQAGAVLTGATKMQAVAYSPFGGTDGYCAIDDRGHLWKSPGGYAKQVLASSPKLYWRLGEGVGAATAADASGHGMTGSYASGVTLGQAGAITGDTDTAALLNNTSAAYVFADNAYQPWVAGASRSFMGWAKRLATSDIDPLVGGTAGPTIGAVAPKLYLNSGNNDVIFETASGSNVTWAAAWPGTGTWVHWAFTYNDTTKVAELFINGVSKGTKTLTATYTYNNALLLGAFKNGQVSYTGFNGGMDEFAVWETIISAATITGIYNAASAVWTDKGAALSTKQRPVFFNDKLHVFDKAGAAVPIKFDGATISNNPLTGLTSVYPKYGTAYKSRLVIATDTTLYFSNVLDGTTYDVDSFVKATFPITGVAALPNMIAIFSAGHVERLRGTTPPSSLAAGDMALEPAFTEGCVDARSIVVYQDQMIWANLNGVHASDGAGITNLVEVGGIKEYWHSLMSSYSSGWVVAAGIFKGRYVLSITDATGAFVAGFMCDLRAKTWTFLSNLPVSMFTESQGATSELVMALSNHNYLGYFASCFDPSSGASDGDGTAVQPSIEFPFFRMGTGKMRWRDIFLGVDLLNAGSQTGELEFWYTTTPDSDSYTQLVDDAGNPVAIGGTNGLEVQRIPLHLQSNGLGLKVSQVGASARTALFDLEAEMRDLEGRL